MPSVLTSKTLRISLGNAGQADPRPTIRPGTVLYGEVYYKPPYPENVVSLTINLLGKLVVKAPKGRRDVTQLFSVQHPILRKDDDEPVQVGRDGKLFEWHFVVPWATEYNRTGTYKPDNQNLFVESSHRIPPALMSRKGDAQVLYSISAVVRKKGFAWHNLNTLTDLPIGEELEIPECLVELSEVEPGVLQEIKQDLTPPALSSGFFRRRSAISESEATTLGCTVTLSGSQTLILGEGYEIKGCIAHSDPSGAQLGEHRWSIAIKGVILIARVHRRFKDDDTVLHDEESYKITWTPTPLVIKPGEPVSKEIAIGSLVNVVPSFKSYTISRSYRLRITILSSVEGKNGSGSEQHQMDIPVEVVRKVGTLPMRASSVAVASGSGRDVEPPPYEDSPSYQ